MTLQHGDEVLNVGCVVGRACEREAEEAGVLVVGGEGLVRVQILDARHVLNGAQRLVYGRAVGETPLADELSGELQ